MPKPGRAPSSAATRTLQPPSVASPPPAARVAWPVGKIHSNKEEAVVRFLEKKRDKGVALTATQQALVSKFHADAAAQVVAAAAAASSSPASAAAAAAAAASAAVAPALSLGDRLGMSLEQLAASRRSSDALRLASPLAASGGGGGDGSAKRHAYTVHR